MTIFKALFASLWGYDLIIVALILFNFLVIFIRLKAISSNLNKRLRKVVYLPVEHKLKQKQKQEQKEIDIHELIYLREKETRLYHTYISVANILPLMGILGTVISLMGIKSFTNEMITANFLTALTSTFWGLMGAVIFKILEGDIVFKVDLNQENMTMLLNLVLGEREYYHET